MHKLRGITSIFAATLAVMGMGQVATTDHPNLKGNNQRTGVNGDVPNSGPGFLNTTGTGAVPTSALRWFVPLRNSRGLDTLRLNEINPFKTIIDNTDYLGAGGPSAINFEADGVTEVGPFDPLPNGFAASNGTWSSTLEVNEAAPHYTLPVRRNRNVANTVPAFQALNPNPRFPSYNFARTTASASGQGQDPRIAAVPANLSDFTWTFVPRINDVTAAPFTFINDAAPKAYAIYVHFPVGPTNIGGTLVYPQRYYAYEITYGVGQRYIDIVDTDRAGGGWVRLGNGGRPTNQMFPYAGLDASSNPFPLKVRLLNTIPRDGNDTLTETVNGSLPDNRYLVYADAVQFSTETNSYLATPTSAGFGTGDIRVIGAENQLSIDPTTIPFLTNFRSKPTTVSKGVVSSYDFNDGADATGNPRWRYSPIEQSSNAFPFDNTSPRWTIDPIWTLAADNTNQRGIDYLTTPGLAAPTASVFVDPNTDLTEGSYEVWFFVGADAGGGPVGGYARAASYIIRENGTDLPFTIDLSGPPGWRRLGDRRYSHSVANRLRVTFSNGVSGADIGRNLYVDEVRFVKSVSTNVTSSPVHARVFIRETPGGVPVEKNVVIVADETGRLHCLDASGNSDGTTTCYWTYPSSTTNALDPNLQVGQDVTDPAGQKFDGENDALLAQMATGFDLSTAVVERLTVPGPAASTITRDYLFIGSTNGRVYSIAMEGRGDFNATTRTAGSTYRRWTYPQTYPATSQNSQLGDITSVVSANLTISGNPTDVILVGTEQGRIYCLRADGDFDYSGTSELKTSVIWQFPQADQPTLNSIVSPPALDVANNRLFIATTADDDQGSEIRCIDPRTGTSIWTKTAFTGSSTWLDFTSGMAYVPASVLNVLPSLGGAMPDTLFAMNENGFVYAFNAGTGAEIWQTNELQSSGRGSLIYTEIISFDPTGTTRPFPVIMVPTNSGRFAGLFARLGEETRFGNRQAWGFRTDSPIEATMSVSNKWLYGATTSGYLYAWSDRTNAGTFAADGFQAPGYEDITDNNQDALYEDYRNTRVAYLSEEGYRRLRRTSGLGDNKGRFNFADVIDNAVAYTAPNGQLIAPYRNVHGDAFEWGETIYVIAYNFPIRVTDPSGLNEVAPPIIQFGVTTEGRSVQPVTSEGRLFLDKNYGDADGGYAVAAIPLTGGGNGAQTPGPGTIQTTLRTSATNNQNQVQVISLNPATSRLAYRVANPIGISVEQNFGSNALERLGYTVDAAREDSLLNGSRDISVTGLGNVLGGRFGKSVGVAAHGGAKKTNVWVFDRSLMTLLRGEGRGIDNVRVDRRDLRWQGGATQVSKAFANVPILGAALGTFEDLPTQFPNISLDYPDLAREQVRVRKDPNGSVENPVYSGVQLRGPTVGGAPVTSATAATRTIVPTQFELQVDVPRFQPPNLGASSIPNQTGSPWFAGYAGRFTVYVDSDNNSNYSGQRSREAYRTFNLAAAVAPDTRITIGNPNIDLGSLAAGAGYDARLNYGNTRPYRVLSPTEFFNPYATGYSKMFKPMQIFNEGNTNLWNVRVAKGSFDQRTGLYWPWQILSNENDDQVWFDAATDLHSDIDRNFAPEWVAGANNVILQKPRVGDVSGKKMFLNPSSRLNPNIVGSGRTLGQLLTPGNPRPDLVREPRVGISVPFGMPVGRYSQLMRVLEDTGSGVAGTVNDEAISLGYANATAPPVPLEGFSDPTFTLSFGVKETRLTGGVGDYSSAVIHEGLPTAQFNPAQWADIQPTGFRRGNGDLVIGFASNRPQLYPNEANPNPNNRNTRIYVGSIAGGTTGAADGSRGMDSWTRDLSKFRPADPANARWWGGTAVLPNLVVAELFPNVLDSGVPTPTQLFGAYINGSDTYGNPVFSSLGDRDVAGNPNTANFIAYTGSVKRSNTNGAFTDNRIFVTRLNIDGSVGTTYRLDADALLKKENLSMIQNGTTVILFYTAGSGSNSRIYRTEFTESGGFTTPTAINFGSGFESVASPSATARFHRNGSLEIDMAFTARLRNSNVNEVFMSRLQAGASGWNAVPFGLVNTDPGQLQESPTYDARAGGFRARGVNWLGDYSVTLSNGTPIINGVATVDRQTQIQSYPTIFGGNMIVDKTLGVIKFTQAALPKNTTFLLKYTPQYLRMTNASGVGFAAPNLLFDGRLAPSNTATTYSFWKTPGGADEPANSGNTFAHRFILTAIRGASGGGQASRPITTSFRFGVRWGSTIAVRADGTIPGLTVTGNVGAFQVDPSAGRIYFTAADEDRVVRININGIFIDRVVSLIGETGESFVPMDAPVNEANFMSFLDPVGDATNRRGLIWMLWSTTRHGSPNLYMQGVARKITPLLPPQ